jgi:hypothetical protein
MSETFPLTTTSGRGGRRSEEKEKEERGKRSIFSVVVKRHKDRFELEIDSRTTVDEVFERCVDIVETKGALKRTMKLIVGGKTVTAEDGKKAFADVVAKKKGGGTKIIAMMLDVPTPVGGTTTRMSTGASLVAEKRRREAKEKMMERKEEGRTKEKTSAADKTGSFSSSSVWEKTGICSSQNSGLDALPMAALEALRADAKVKVFDFSFNSIANVPNSVFTLQPLRTVTRISLPSNQLENAGIDFKVMFKNLKFLKYLDVSNNNLSGAMDIQIDSDEDEDGKQRPPLHLNLSRNRITSFTRSFFKCCPPLQLFDANENHICESMEHYFVGSETTLAHVNLANNKHIDTIPSSFKNMKSLQSLIVDGNRIDKNGIPAIVLRQCERLSELSLKRNQVTIEELRELDGWMAYNERRVSRADKILDAKTMLGDASFREGADAERYARDF